MVDSFMVLWGSYFVGDDSGSSEFKECKVSKDDNKESKTEKGKT